MATEIERAPGLRECVEAERAQVDAPVLRLNDPDWTPAKHNTRVAAIHAARAATDEAVGRVEASRAAITPERIEALQIAHDASSAPWCAGESCQALAAIRALREFVTTTGGAGDE